MYKNHWDKACEDTEEYLRKKIFDKDYSLYNSLAGLLEMKALNFSNLDYLRESEKMRRNAAKHGDADAEKYLRDDWMTHKKKMEAIIIEDRKNKGF